MAQGLGLQDNPCMAKLYILNLHFREFRDLVFNIGIFIQVTECVTAQYTNKIKKKCLKTFLKIKMIQVVHFQKTFGNKRRKYSIHLRNNIIRYVHHRFCFNDLYGTPRIIQRTGLIWRFMIFSSLVT